MVAYRQRGLVNLHALLCAVIGTLFFFVYAEVVRATKVFDLLPAVDLWPYVGAVALGMLVSNSFVREAAFSLHSISLWRAFVLASKQGFVVGAVVFALIFASKDKEVSRLFVGTYLVELVLLLTLLHGLQPRALSRLLFPAAAQLPTLFVGSLANVENLGDWIKDRGHLGIRPVGFLSEDTPSRAEKLLAPRLGSVSDLRTVLKDRNVGQVIVLEWPSDPTELEQIIASCETEGCRLLILNSYGTRFARTFVPVEEAGQHFMALQDEPLQDPFNRLMKRVLDIVVSLPVVVFVLPPLALWVWAMHRLQSPGPLMFIRPRGGVNRTSFPMFKFRSMQIAPPDPLREAVQASATDERVFSFGRFMRKTSLDEFPQFLNVLLGHMSLVGPRPHPVLMDERFSAETRAYHMRSFVKPGITGLAQVRGFRGEIDDPNKLHQRIYWDLYYINNWSLALDFRVIFMTGWQVLFPPESAY